MKKSKWGTFKTKQQKLYDGRKNAIMHTHTKKNKRKKSPKIKMALRFKNEIKRNFV